MEWGILTKDISSSQSQPLEKGEANASQVVMAMLLLLCFSRAMAKVDLKFVYSEW